jgi:endonuclease/exonuclease/phosphatase family metal-dependent hydrolase
MSEEEVQENLSRIYALIREVDPDVLMTEEIEVNSRRSAYVNMVTGILEHTRMNYAAYIPTWRSRYIPSEGLGRMDLGNAIFSKYPIRRAERIPQEDRTDQDPATSYFYIHRAVGRAEIDVGPRRVVAMVVHTEAYDKDGTKQKQLRQIQSLLEEERGPFVIGGDFNALPPTALQVSGFPDESPDALGTDFEQPPYDLDEMDPFFEDYLPAISLDRIGTTEDEQRDYFTHSVIGRDREGTDGEPGFWNRTLDYLFTDRDSGWVSGTTDVLQEPGRGFPPIEGDLMELSDHAPVVGEWELSP